MGETAAAVGPGAALALTGAQGQPPKTFIPTPAATAGPASWGAAAFEGLTTGADVVVVDAGARSDQVGPGEIDARVGAILDAVGAAGDSGARPAPAVAVASLSNPNPAFGFAWLSPSWTEPAAAGQAPQQLALIRSATTGTAGLVSSLDLTAVLEARRVPAPIGAVNPWTEAEAGLSAAEVADRLRDAGRHAQAARAWAQVGWTAVLTVAGLACLIPLLRLAADRRRKAAELGRRWEIMGLIAGSWPAAGFAVNAWPWWRAAAPGLAWLAASGAVAGGIGLGAWALTRTARGRVLGSPLGAPGLVGLASAAILLADPFVGGVFTRDAPMGHQTLLAARFFGYANTSFAVVAVTAALTAALIAGGGWTRGRRGQTGALIAAVGLGVAAVVGYPTLGADLGGALTVSAGFAVMALAGADVRISWRVAAGAALAGAAAAAGAAWWDHGRGPGRWTHLGAFAETAISGGLWEVLARKGAVWLRLSLGPAVAFVALALVVVWLRRRGAFEALETKRWRSTPLRLPLIWGLATILTVGSLVNDSGLTVAVTGLAVLGPMLTAAMATSGRTASGAGRRP
jgi:hypothetical protein